MRDMAVGTGRTQVNQSNQGRLLGGVRLGQAAETEWGLIKPREGETTTISVKALPGRKIPLPVGMLGAQSSNNDHPGGSR